MKSKDDAITAGVNVDNVQHTMNRRLFSHDYRAVGTYMLTLVVEGRIPLFGKLCGTADDPKVKLSALGETISDVEQKKISHYYPMVEVWKLCVMPDHLHLIVRVKAPLPEGRHLGHVVSGFKSGCSRAWWALQDAAAPCGEPQNTGASSAVPSAPVSCGSPQEATAARRPVLFEKGYCDKILLRDGQLDNWKRYLDDNPRRLFIKRLHPEYFTVLHQVQLMDHPCQIIGNQFLLNIPDKAAVIVHRAYSDHEFEDHLQKWLSLGEAGGVLISAAISPREKIVMREAMNRGYRLILLRENGFPPLYKPSGEAFNACSEGRLLQVSPWEYHMQRRTISREQCLFLNRLAEHLAQ